MRSLDLRFIMRMEKISFNKYVYKLGNKPVYHLNFINNSYLKFYITTYMEDSIMNYFIYNNRTIRSIF